MKLRYSICFVFFFYSADAQTTKSPEPVKVTGFGLVMHKVAPSDSTYLRIKFDNKGYKISLLNDSLYTTDLKYIDDYISANKKKIDKDKILVTGNSDVPYARFKELQAILSKHEFYKYSLVAKHN